MPGGRMQFPRISKNFLEMPPIETKLSRMPAVTDIMQDVLKLPRTERSFLAKKLLESLETDETFETEEMRIFEGRSREIREGTVKPLTLEQLQQEMAARLA